MLTRRLAAARLTVVLEEFLEHFVEGRAMRELRHVLRALLFHGLGGGNIDDGFGDAVDEIGEAGRTVLRHGRRAYRQSSGAEAERKDERDGAALSARGLVGRSCEAHGVSFSWSGVNISLGINWGATAANAAAPQ